MLKITKSSSKRQMQLVQEDSRRFRKVREGARRFKKVQEGSATFQPPSDSQSRLYSFRHPVTLVLSTTRCFFANSDLLSLHQCFSTAPEREHQQMKDTTYVIRSLWQSLNTAHRLKYIRKRDPWLHPRYVGIFICVSIA